MEQLHTLRGLVQNRLNRLNMRLAELVADQKWCMKELRQTAAIGPQQEHGNRVI